ncbi:S-adenosyl-L-methionine-dependent methyltransferase [Xylariaceae sp. FL1019]|nr:S-adenosyl-L-methionine-dependent methyltransferase [Xylariaceae sp. FL1019]
MSLYHETADILSAPTSTGGNLKTRIFTNKSLKSPPQQIYALAIETCKWSSVLKEVIDAAELLRHERKLTPLLSLLLTHDFLLAKKGIALPASHGLRQSIERHKGRLTSEFTRARLRRKAGSVDALRDIISLEFLGEAGRSPRWVRINTLKTTLQEQLDTTFQGFTKVSDVKDVVGSASKCLYVDEHVPNLLALSPGFEIIKTQAYTSGAAILQDKASCFPAYLLDPQPGDGDVMDSCAAPGNKTTHVAAIVRSKAPADAECPRKVYACEKDPRRAQILQKMVNLAGANEITELSLGQDFLKLNPTADIYSNVGALLLDPSCSGSGIVGRDSMPTIHLPDPPTTGNKKPTVDKSRKRKRENGSSAAEEKPEQVLVDDDGQETVVSSKKELQIRLDALASFQLTLLLHAFTFPAARRVTYSTCSIHAEENEQVVLKALQSPVGKARGWRIMKREQQVEGMRKWPVRGDLQASGGNEEVAGACIRSYQDDGLGVMGFFVAGFVRDGSVDEVVTTSSDIRSTAISESEKTRDVSKDEPEMEKEGSGERDVDSDDGFSDDAWGGFDD